MKVKYWLRDHLRDLQKEELFKGGESERGMVWTTSGTSSKHETACWPAGGLLVCWGPLRTNQRCSPAMAPPDGRAHLGATFEFLLISSIFSLFAVLIQCSIRKVKPSDLNLHFLSWTQKANTSANNQHDTRVSKLFEIQQIEAILTFRHNHVAELNINVSMRF